MKNFKSVSASTQLTVTTFTAFGKACPLASRTVVVLCHNPGARAGRLAAPAAPLQPSTKPAVNIIRIRMGIVLPNPLATRNALIFLFQR